MKDKIIEILENNSIDICIEGFGDDSQPVLEMIADEIMELLQTDGWVKMRSKSQARRIRLQLEEKPGPFRKPIIEVGDNSLVTEEKE